ncbi:MAG: GTP 3',8-cyclase MoaA [Bacteroidales bacterium]|nr:GTP 3',8-cyclase MoaA [Bacteroidales bacterium]
MRIPPRQLISLPIWPLDATALSSGSLPLAPLPTDSAATGELVDRFGRRHDNLRISVTDRCNLRCTYCMPEDVVFQDRSALLTFEEITTFVRVAVRHGITKVRLTGGEPLMRRDLPILVQMLTAIPELTDIGLTTNGVLLDRWAEPLFQAGLRRLNVSLDTLDPARFRQRTRREERDRVLTGLQAARQAGFPQIKVNAVAIRGETEQDIVPLARFCRAQGFALRFIEYMPIGAEPWEREKVLSASEILAMLSRDIAPLVPLGDRADHAPADRFAYADGIGEVGMIASVTHPFCTHCNRLRLTAEGKLRNCLFALDEIDIKPYLRRASPDIAAMSTALVHSTRTKWAGHTFNTTEFVKPTRTMHAIGG